MPSSHALSCLVPAAANAATRVGTSNGADHGRGGTRRSLLAGAALLAAPWISRARAADAATDGLSTDAVSTGDAPAFDLRLGHPVPATFPLHYRLVEAAGQIAIHSHGKVRLRIFPSAQLGSPVGLLAQVRSGKLDAAALSNETLATDLNVMTLPYLGFAWRGYAHLWKALDGDFGAMLVRQMKDRLGLIAIPRCMDFGFRQITTARHVIRTAADLKGLRIRTPSDAPFIQLLQALGARPVDFSLTDMDKALKAGAVDGQQSLLALVKVLQLWDSQTHCALTNHTWDGHWVLFGHKIWENLPPDMRTIVSDAIAAAVAGQRADTAENNAATRTMLEKHGMAFNDIDVDSFRSALRDAGYYKAWRGRVPEEAWSALEKAVGPLAGG